MKTAKKIINIISAILVIFSLAVFVLSFAENIVARSAETYAYYFNDSSILNKIYTSYSNNEMADEIASYFNSLTDEPFAVYEDIGYDKESLFSAEDGENMLIVKKELTKGTIFCFISLAVTVAIFIYLLKQDKKKALRDMSRISILLTLAGIFFMGRNLVTNAGHEFLREKIGLMVLPEGSQLALILNHDFISMAGKVYIGAAVIILAAVVYVTHALTKQQHIFHRGVNDK